MHRFAFLTLVLLAACGKDDNNTLTADTNATEPASTAETADTTPTSSGTGTGSGSDTGTMGGTSAATSTTSVDETTSDETTSPTSGATDPGSSSDTTATTDTTTGVGLDFNRFLMNKAAGPCPPDADCDGFVELLAPGTLRVEKFGDVGDPVTEVQISADDFDAAAAVFADPELFALLSLDDVPCEPPTDIFEDMLVDLGGDIATNTTTTCDNPPIAAARAKANELEAKYVP